MYGFHRTMHSVGSSITSWTQLLLYMTWWAQLSLGSRQLASIAQSVRGKRPEVAYQVQVKQWNSFNRVTWIHIDQCNMDYIIPHRCRITSSCFIWTYYYKNLRCCAVLSCSVLLVINLIRFEGFAISLSQKDFTKDKAWSVCGISLNVSLLIGWIGLKYPQQDNELKSGCFSFYKYQLELYWKK